MYFLIAVYRRFFPAPDTAKLVCKLDKTVCKLQALEARKRQEAINANALREQAILMELEAQQEAKRAGRVAAKIAELIN